MRGNEAPQVHLFSYVHLEDRKTLDKLEAIPGFRTALGVDESLRVLADAGLVMIGQSGEVAPADRRIYALRDVTATIESFPLIASSIMSKKLAEGIDGLRSST